TLVMVFALQHTQTRHQAAVQRKLDELLRVQPGADQRLLHVELAHQAELDQLAEHHEAVRDRALTEEPTRPLV
ncbi:MAG TPA: low affinity iron permease family protein, partial [Mycobacteriales bacterium]|nr:low affinity iron permease family protein [Mycobacteriales bacterium]